MKIILLALLLLCGCALRQPPSLLRSDEKEIPYRGWTVAPVIRPVADHRHEKVPADTAFELGGALRLDSAAKSYYVAKIDSVRILLPVAAAPQKTKIDTLTLSSSGEAPPGGKEGSLSKQELLYKPLKGTHINWQADRLRIFIYCAFINLKTGAEDAMAFEFRVRRGK